MAIWEKIIVAVIAGMFGLIPVIMQWLSNRAKRKSLLNKLESLKSELDFLQTWKNLFSDINKDKINAENEKTVNQIDESLRDILKRYATLQRGEVESREEKPKGIKQISFIQKALLLFTPSSPKGWLLHSLFYILCFMFITMLITGLTSPIENKETGENEFMYLLLGSLFLFVLPAVYIRFLAVKDYIRTNISKKDNSD